MSDFKVRQALTLALTEAHRQRSSILGAPHLFIALTQLDGVTAAASPVHRFVFPPRPAVAFCRWWGYTGFPFRRLFARASTKA